MQVVYLVVNAIPNNNFSSLYISIGAALDNALGNFIPVYEEQVRKRKSLGDKAEKIRELVQKYNIGIIIFDEIQLIDFKNANEKSFESLLTLCNRTKVAIGVIGTEDAHEKMFSSVLRKARRTGALINANRYCSDYNYFKYIAQNLFKYQWFDKHVPLTVELFETLLECSKGIVDQLIGIYMFMQIDYLKSNNKPEIDREFILKVVNRHYPGIRKILNNLDKNPFESDKTRAEITKKANSEMISIFRNTQDEYKESVLNSNSRTSEDLCRRVVHNVQNIFDEYSSSDIINAYNKVLNIKDNKNLGEKKLTQETIKILTSSPAPKEKKTKKPKLTSLQLDRYNK